MCKCYWNWNTNLYRSSKPRFGLTGLPVAHTGLSMILQRVRNKVQTRPDYQYFERTTDQAKIIEHRTTGLPSGLPVTLQRIQIQSQKSTRLLVTGIGLPIQVQRTHWRNFTLTELPMVSIGIPVLGVIHGISWTTASASSTLNHQWLDHLFEYKKGFPTPLWSIPTSYNHLTFFVIKD